MEKEIDQEYHKAKRFTKGHYLPFIIYKRPAPFNKESVIDNQDSYPFFNEKEIKEWVTTMKSFSKTKGYVYFFIFLFFSVFIPVNELISSKPMSSKYFYIVIGLGLFFAVLSFLSWRKFKVLPGDAYITFDRKNSRLTLPKSNDKEYFTILFKHLKATRRSFGTASYYSGPELLFFRDTRNPRPWRFNDEITMSYFSDEGEPKDVWSFYVWYMDKNRPLPPGDAFDAFRDADFERRKADGFPAPLFKSLIPTPEAIAEQQLVREAFWKDEDYIASEQEAHFSLWKNKP
jgi:hypothetical protein